MSLKVGQDSLYLGNNVWTWSIWIEGSTEELDRIERVMYVLHPSFASPVRFVVDRASNFKLTSQGWGIFVIRIFVTNSHGSTISLEHELKLDYSQPLPDEASAPGPTERVNELTPDAAASEEIQREIRKLAEEYEDLRRSMPAGDPRTRKMGTIAAKMRSLAGPGSQFLNNLTESSSAGDRLAAVSMLEAVPNPSYLTWLADRIQTEKPFIGYHAAKALLCAARTLSSSHRIEIQEAIMKAQAHLDGRDWKDPNQVAALKRAEEELNDLA